MVMRKIDEFYLGWNEPVQSCLVALRAYILESADDLREQLKYNMPCFLYKEKPLCYLWVDKKINWPYILFVDGGKMLNKELEQGKRSRMKVFNIDPCADFPLYLLEKLFEEAYTLRR